MIRTLSILVCLSWMTHLAQGQNFKKLDKLYQKKDYTKLKKAAHKFRKKYKQSPEPYLYLAQAEANTPRRIIPAWNYYKTAYAKDRTVNKEIVSQASSLQDKLKKHLKKQGESFLSRKDTVRASRMSNELISYFGDSSLYEAVQPKAPEPIVIIEETPKKVEIPVLDAKKFSQPKIQPNRVDMVRFAEKQAGIRYFYTGEQPETGFDCSGFVLYVYRNFGYNFLHNTKEAAQLGKTVALLDSKPGDFVCFGTKNPKKFKSVYHMGIVYSNDGTEVKVIHATVSKGVKVDSLTSGYWSNSSFFIRNVMD